jgi:hypothetical protein
MPQEDDAGRQFLRGPAQGSQEMTYGVMPQEHDAGCDPPRPVPLTALGLHVQAGASKEGSAIGERVADSTAQRRRP